MKDLPVEIIYELHKSGVLVKKIAEMYNVHETTILYRIHKYCNENNLKFKPQSSGHRHKMELPMDEISKLYEANVSSIEIAKKYGCTSSTILNRLHEFYENQDDGKTVRSRGKTTLELPMDEIYELYQLRIPITELAREYNCHPVTMEYKIKDYCNQTGLEVRKYRSADELPLEDIYNCYQNGETYLELADKYGFSRVTISTKLREYCQKNNLVINRKNKYKSQNYKSKIQNQSIFLRQLKEILEICSEKLDDNDEIKKLTKIL